jgi:hypothetical protein
LITRYNLQNRLEDEVSEEPAPPSNGKGKGKVPSQWSQSQSEREETFKKRRDDMILRARQQMQQQVNKEVGS